jgi:hypothetical protein
MAKDTDQGVPEEEKRKVVEDGEESVRRNRPRI